MMMKYLGTASQRLILRPRCGTYRGASVKVLGSAATSFSTSTKQQQELNNNTTTTLVGKKPPFDKVLIANRGEIVQRVVRTCRDLGISTVAVYSTADAQAPFVSYADEAICLGPAAANKSYMNTSAVLRAIQDTGAQAVHPGYGFLSENAAFSKTIVDHNAVWLGPPASAIEQMGDKLFSKKIAQEAGVTIVPGHEKPLVSLEEALQLVHDGKVPYPVLLKAAAGGGGKGMRVCYNDRDLKEGWKVSKAESLQFFGDDRLLLEKFIEKPHHIEFQILASPTANGGTDVIVFPERECSIQRRNQKIIEESPSVLLKEETRQLMAEQVVRLCQAVKYESAGTIEFLVDNNQNFYFLEMNTRLQVEHPVTEQAVGGLDLVKAMLWIGAGWGFTDEIQNMRDGHRIHPTHHAVEARIYAEDPLRGFLPSTGPLSPYVEPITAYNKLRVDSGVAPGHVVTPFYDPMLSKVISTGNTRNEALDNLRQALDEYVIEGVQHNARLIQSVLRQPAFVEGDTPTSFLPTHYPEGFKGVELTKAETEEFAVAAVSIDAARRALFQEPPLAAGDHGSVVVRIGGFFGQPYRVTFNAENNNNTATVQNLAKDTKDGPRTVTLDEPVKFEPRRHIAQVSLNGVSRTIQVLNQAKTGESKMQMYGANISILVQTPREYQLSRHMHVPEVVDTSSLVLSPMPGTLISFAVQAGEEVVDGQELCIVEAMKMQNIIRSPKEGKISALKVKPGDSLKADQVILEFEE